MELSTTPSKPEITLEEIHSFKGKYPKQLWYLFTVEMWERFCFYGMRGILTIFMIDQLLVPKQDAILQYAAIQSFVYAFTFVGGIFADKVLGFKKSLIFGAIMMVLGNALVAIAPDSLFYVGISLVVIGTGFFKPNVSSMVGELYRDGDPRKVAGFGMFYSGINIGALLGGILCVYLGKYVSWGLAFGAASFVMLVGLTIFSITKRQLGPIGNSPLAGMPKKQRYLRELLTYVVAIIAVPLIYILVQETTYTDYFMAIIGPAALVYFFIKYFQEKDAAVRSKLLAALIFILFSVAFFALFEQAGGALAAFSKDYLDHTLLFFQVDPNAVNNSANAFFVIIFSPLLGLFWVWLNRKKKEPNTVVKFGIGFILLALSYIVFYTLLFYINAEGKTSLNVFTGGYFVMTLAELCISPIGLSLITSLSPKKLGGMMMGLWFLGSAYGQYFAGMLGTTVLPVLSEQPSLEELVTYCGGFKTLAIGVFGVAILMFVLIPVMKKLMREVK